MWLVIGISGVTCGGKSSLSKALQDEFPDSVVLCQDHFFLDKYNDRHVFIPELNHQNWDCLQAVDWEPLMKNIGEILKETPPEDHTRLLLIEGHLIFNYQPLAELCQLKYFFTLSKEECFGRRKKRVYDPPDVPGYFDQYVWPMYLTNKAEVDRQYGNTIMYLDGSDKKDVIAEKVISRIKDFISSSKGSLD